MAIRFQCAACSEPIEVDDQWARQVVRCPYCQRTVTAPAESTLPQLDQIPMAGALALPGSTSARPEFAEPPKPAELFPPVPPANKAAGAALILTLIGIAFMMLAMVTIFQNALPMQELQKELEKAQTEGRSAATAMMAYVERHGGVWPRWLLTFVLFEVLSFGSFVAGVVLAVIGLFRPARRGMAVAALILSGAICAYFCLGMLASMVV